MGFVRTPWDAESGLSLAGRKCPWGYDRSAENKGTAYVTHVWPGQPGGREQV